MYKEKRNYINNGFPIYPNGMQRMNKAGFVTLGIRDENRILLGVWKIDSSQNFYEIPLKKLADAKTATKLFPCLNDVACKLDDDILKIEFPDENSAILIELEI